MQLLPPALGARFHAADLHLHTPASHDFNDKNITPEQFVNAAIAKDLEIIAITDHNSAEWVDPVRAAAKGKNLIVFPGVEVSTPHCHILAVFDTDTKKSHLDDFLTTVGITTANRGKKEVNSKPLEDVLDGIKNFGGIAIVAHANSTNGLLQQGTGQYKIKLCGDSRISALEFTQEKHIESFRLGKVPQYPARACIQGSDAHSLSEIGTRRTFLKMDTPSLWGLRQVCHDHEIRVRYEWSTPTTPHAHILSLTATQGFFANTAFTFHAALNCMVGGRGTGKSTAIELLRFCFNDISSIEDIANDSDSKLMSLLGPGGKVTVRFFDSDGVIKIVEREFQEWETDRTIRTEDGAAAELLAPPVFFSQGELTRIAAEPMAQIDLIDRYIDVDDEHIEEKRLLRELKVNAAQLVKLRSEVDSVDSEVTDKETGLEATRKKYKSLEKTLSEPALRDFPLWESESRYLNSADEALTDIATEITDFFDGLIVAQRIDEPEAAAPSRKLLEDAPAVFESLEGDLAAVKKAALARVQQRRLEIESIRNKWNPKFASVKAGYEAALAKAGTDDVKKGQAQLRNLKKRLDELEKKAKGQSSTAKQLSELEAKRDGLADSLKKCRASRFKKRADKAASWNKQFGGKIQLNLAAGGDRSHYVDALRQISKGAMLRDPDLVALASSCSPDRIRDLVESGDYVTLAKESGIKQDNARKFIETASGRPGTELLDLEAVPLPDVPDIRYEAQPGAKRGLGQLSVGQRATVIISLALVEGDFPLVIDQPEEPLDTLAITSPVVETLRGQKESRQFIFTTHNPNVAVGADAELNIVLEAGADKGTIRAAGGVDEISTNKLLVLHLEGGPEAMKRRVRKYRP